MDTAAASTDTGATVGFAIPINQAMGIADNIERGIAKNGIVVGLSAFLGVEVVEVAGGKGAPATGAFVRGVIPGGPAATAGVKAGETITAMDGRALTASPSSLTTILRTLKPGASARLRVVTSKGVASMIPVVLGSIPL
jgi:S1-C subfamily serine protease